MDIPISTCGNMTARRMEMDNIAKEFGGAMLENNTRSEELGGDGFSSGDMGNIGMGENSFGGNPLDGNTGGGINSGDNFGFDSADWGFTEGGNGTSAGGTGSTPGGLGNTTQNPQDFIIGISENDGFCPARAEAYNVEDLSKMGIYSNEDIFKFIKSIGTNFGNIQDDELRATQSPLEGLKFTTMTQDLCSLLFSDQMLLDTLDIPTCTVMTTATQTIISVTVGELARIEPDMVINFKPNVFVGGCDWPLLDKVTLTNGAAPDTLELEFNIKDQVPICEDFSLLIKSHGNIGEVSCLIELIDILDASGNQVVTADMNQTFNGIVEDNYYTAVYGEYYIESTFLSALNTGGVNTLIFKGQ